MHGTPVSKTPDWAGVGSSVDVTAPVTAPPLPAMSASEHAAINGPRTSTETSAAYKKRVAEGYRDYAQRTYDPKTRTQEQLNRDIKPAPFTRPGSGGASITEAQQYARARAQLAEDELVRRGAIREQQLAEALPNGPTVDVAANDAAHGAAHNAHTGDRHGAQVPYSSAGQPPGTRTIESRVTTGDGWNKVEPRSFQWNSDAEMNATINKYIKDNWSTIKDELALRGYFDMEKIPLPSGTTVGKGFVQGPPSVPGGTPTAIPTNATTFALKLRMVDGVPPQVVVLTSFPSP
jgi:hypothetical protein